jgi:hypothetical protein
VDPSATWVDVVAVSLLKTDSVGIRPGSSPKVIELLAARTSRPANEILSCRDLFLRLKGDAVKLFWKGGSSEVEIRPFFGTPIDIRKKVIGLFRRLSLPLSHDSWHPGRRLKMENRRFPRLTIGRVVLYRATWRLDVEEARKNISDDPWETFRSWQKWRSKNELPRFVFVYPNVDLNFWRICLRSS